MGRGQRDGEEDAVVVGEWEGEGAGGGDGKRGRADEVEGVTMFVGGKVNMLGDVKAVKEHKEVRCERGGWQVNMDVEVTCKKEAGGEGGGNGEEFREIRHEGWVGLGGAVE